MTDVGRATFSFWRREETVLQRIEHLHHDHYHHHRYVLHSTMTIICTINTIAGCPLMTITTPSPADAHQQRHHHHARLASHVYSSPL
jgi:hypothetical protein